MNMRETKEQERREDCLSVLPGDCSSSKKNISVYEQEEVQESDNFAVECIDNVGPYDVLCGRQREAFRNVGNRRFRVTISLSLDKYLNAPTRYCKSSVIGTVVNQIKGNGGRFLRWWNDEWVELDEKQAREKVGHALRDMALARENNLLRKKRCSYEGFIRHPSFFYPCLRSKSTSLTSDERLNDEAVSVREVSARSPNRDNATTIKTSHAMSEHPIDIPLDLVDELLSWEEDLQLLLDT